MEKSLRNIVLLAALCLCVAVCGCATGNAITLSDGPSRPAAKEVSKVEGAPKAAVIDFSWEAHPSSEIGRDFDNVRSIVWNGNAGRTMADLIAGVLMEKGIPVARVAKVTEVPEGVPARVWGRVEDFRVNAKRSGLGAVVEIEANIALKLEGSGPGAPPGWNTTVSSSYRYPEPLFILAGDVLHVLNRTANDVAEEGVRQMLQAGLVAAPAAADPKAAEPKAGESKTEEPKEGERKIIEENIGAGGNK